MPRTVITSRQQAEWSAWWQDQARRVLAAPNMVKKIHDMMSKGGDPAEISRLMDENQITISDVADWHEKHMPANPEVTRLTDEFQKAYPGIWVEPPRGSDPRVLKDAFAGLGAMMTKYPHHQLKALRAMTNGDYQVEPHSPLGTTVLSPYPHSPYASEMVFAPYWASNYAGLEEEGREAQESGWTLPHPKVSQAYQTALHEFGHVLSMTGGGRAAKQARQALQDYYVEHYGDDEKGWKPWLLKNLPDIAIYDPDEGMEEALAEAFADVEINGDQAREASKVLHKLLVDHSLGKIPGVEPRVRPVVTARRVLAEVEEVLAAPRTGRGRLDDA